MPEISRTPEVEGANPADQTMRTGATFQINSAKLYVAAATLSINDHIEILENINQEFRRTISWNKYRSEIRTQTKNNNLDYLSNPTFRKINRLFVLFSYKWLTIYKSFLRPHLDYGYVIFDRNFNEIFLNKPESAQYNSAIAITGAIRGSSREKPDQKLGVVLLKSLRRYRKLCSFFKLKKNKHPSYLFDKILINKGYQKP